MKGFMKEFKEFIAQGNVMDLAVGIIIGGAFTAIVTSLTDSVINPFIKFITGGGTDSLSVLVVPGTEIDFGAFISAIINFLIIALVVFLLVKGVNNIRERGMKVVGANGEEVREQPPSCPFCLEEVKEGATHCPHCSAVLPEPAKPVIEPATD